MKVIKFISVVTIALVMVSCNNQRVTKKSLETELDSVSYALGLDIGEKIKDNFGEIDEDLYIQGVLNGIDSTNLLLESKDVTKVINTYFRKKQEEQREKAQKIKLEKAEKEFADVKAEGIKFLEENKSKEGVQVTESGLQYVVIKEGTGDKPTAASKVKVHYHGTLIDGTVFDSSVERNKPSEFFVNRVIKGWTEGLQLMSVGSKYKFFIPQELAYGAFPRQGGKIKPFSPLVFEVELLEIVKK
ncbi:FKBP-type peptidyl-prolyl cis-trans isomerase [Lutibacter sp. B1]|uniref:FKBP-type peptidyl-prolyl cis-trans isomerase n=1 Tax=Lutibacter sp. B1 TaxID=2725996 RepID=UPI0014570734|nr:FKBP-type peptidyl-prolyl cis-trans isomerase [Lutibacter sp. B1]NLP58395.1 FKBP-type peptidyl-prolyl cis-trans isomerase [Lutibacter sp. B1]